MPGVESLSRLRGGDCGRLIPEHTTAAELEPEIVVRGVELVAGGRNDGLHAVC